MIEQWGQSQNGHESVRIPPLVPSIPSENAAVPPAKVTTALSVEQLGTCPRSFRRSTRILPLHQLSTDAPFAMPDSNPPRPLGEVLKEVIDQLDVQEEIDEARVVETWASLAGKEINGVTESVWMDGATLYVKITSAAWRQELHMNRRKWRERLNGELDTDPVEEIVFR